MGIENVKIRPMNVYLGKDTMQVVDITTRGSSAANTLIGKYFLLLNQAGSKFAVWFDDGFVADPSVPGYTLTPVMITEGDSASTIATSLASVLTALTGYDATSSANVVTLTSTVAGFITPPRDPESPNGSGFTFKITTLGQVETLIGCIDGDIEITGLQPDKEDITCHATGTTVRGQLISGYPLMTVGMAFKETDKATIKKALVAAGHYPITPVGTGAAEVLGYGPTQVGQQIPTSFMRLHPIEKGTGDKSEDWNFWKAEAMLDTFTFSGESISNIPLTFQIFPDETKNQEIQFFMIGDGTVSGLGVA